jgi:hypothetical protein
VPYTRKGSEAEHRARADPPAGRLASGHRARSPMSDRFHARSLTDGVPVRSMKQLFELALRLEPPWRVVSSDFDFERR